MAILGLLQVGVGCLIIPMMCLGLMAGLSGGGLTPSFQRIGELLLGVSPALGIVSLIISVVLARFGFTTLAYVAIAFPLVFWIVMIVWLQRDTGFFF